MREPRMPTKARYNFSGPFLCEVCNKLLIRAPRCHRTDLERKSIYDLTSHQHGHFRQPQKLRPPRLSQYQSGDSGHLQGGRQEVNISPLWTVVDTRRKQIFSVTSTCDDRVATGNSD